MAGLRQLTALDAQFLAIETDRNYGHVGGLAVLDPSTAPGGELTLEDLKSLILDRLHLITPFTERLVAVPFNIDWPYWTKDEHFDIGYHCREIALPAPGSHEQLLEQVGRIYSRRLDRSRPLWEIYLIHGLEGGRVALLSKSHHAAIDGMSGSEILTALYDITPEPREVEQPEETETPSAPDGRDLLAIWARGIPRAPINIFDRLTTVVPHVDMAVAAFGVPGSRRISRVMSRVRIRLGADEDHVIERPPVKAPRGPYGAALSPHRVFGLGSVSLNDVKTVKNAFGVKVNDVVICLVAGAVREHLTFNNELPEEPLLGMIPVSVRTEEEKGTFGNKVSAMIAPLPTHIDSPVERLEYIHSVMRAAKDSHDALPAESLRDLTAFVPPALHARAARVVTQLSGRFTRPPWNVIISNVPGPPIDLYFAGAKLEAMFPLSIISDGIGLNVTIMSYRDSIDIGITADREQTPEVQTLVDGMQSELELLLAAAKAAA
ncbi:MAG: wax ester/triacylglycerol synthase family O-acyltransferase [Solirubrobacterales bacterium]|nr:wax ester/triacylglycerol synthase family O-acyltransferase [Solirubrobacterales bacterium]HMT06010.1 wax ester/triacylglycerol synthase family O-acyltransferase [Solirubrobacterales bacterium]